jgi:mitochondrial import inner membrane translocase subunit TIM50
VRPVIDAYKGKNVPIEYAKKEAEAKEKFLDEWRAGSGLVHGGFTLSKLFGGPAATVSHIIV